MSLLTRRALLALLALLLLRPAVGAGEERLHLVILHTNDVHGQVVPRLATWLKDRDPLPTSGGLARLAAAVERELEAARRAGAQTLVIDAGDWWQGTPEGRIEDGLAFLAALNEIPYDVMVVGNHEFDHGTDVLLEHLAAVKPPALLANARDSAGEGLPGTRPLAVVERLGLRIALVGFCSTHTPQMTHPSAGELTWREPAEVLTELMHGLDAEVDWVLPITHVGVGGDQDLARAHPALDLIVGGHSHSFLRNGVQVRETLIVQAGAKASALGRVDVWFDATTRQVTDIRCRLIELYDEPAERHRNPAVERACAALVERSEAAMGVVVGRLTGDLPRGHDRYVTSPSGNLVTDVMRARTGADVAIQNRGGLRANLLAGPVTRRHLFQLLPFDNHLVTVTISGSELEELMRSSLEGEGGRSFEFSGMLVGISRAQGRPQVQSILIAGAPLDPAGRYTVTANSFNAAGGDGFEILAQAQERQVDPILLRDLLEEAFAGGELAPPTENRFR